jgi:hypothetical protein
MDGTPVRLGIALHTAKVRRSVRALSGDGSRPADTTEQEQIFMLAATNVLPDWGDLAAISR